MSKPISSWAFTQATAEMDCPKCKQSATAPCRTPKGRRKFIPHAERTKAYREKIGWDEFMRRHSRPMNPL